MKKSRKKWVLAGAVVLLALLGAVYHETVRVIWCNLTAPKLAIDTSDSWEGGASYERLRYADVSENDYMNLYVPDSDEPMPLFVLIHGGGFVFNDCESRQAQFMYRYFRDHGYACASVNYRLAQEAPFPGAVEDVKAAIRFLKANADTYGYDGEKIAVWGESAGGYLSVMAGVTGDEDFHHVKFIGEDDLAEPVTADVPVVVNFYGAAQMEAMVDDFEALGIPGAVRWAAGLWLKSALKDTGFEDVKSYWLRKDVNSCTEEERNQFDPYYFMEKNLNADSDLQMLIWHGDADLDVPYLQSKRMYETLGKKIGQDKVQLELFSGYKHADDRFYSEESLAAVREYLDNAFA